MSSSSNLSKFEKEKLKLVQEKCLALLNEMLQDDDNKYCIDCDAKGPRWASFNLGIFLCIRCAGIHRNLGVHISKVRSVNLDSWTPEMVVSMQHMGNSKGRAVYEANIPDNFRRPQTDVALENFIRAKYEHKKYIAQEWKPINIGKVNWDAEIEESIKKKKEIKRQQLNDNNNIGLFPTTLAKPKIPPPTNSSSSTASAKKQPQEIKKDNVIKSNEIKSTTTTTTASEDLLGLSSGLDDLNLSSTLNGPGGQQTQNELLSVGASTNESSGDPFASPLKSGSTTTNQDDLGSLFLSNSTAGDGLDNSLNSKMSKDSILSLYGQSATSPINPFGNPNMFGMNPQQQQGQQFQQQQQQSNIFNQMMGQPPQAINLNDPMKAGGLFDIQQQLQGLNMNIPSTATPNFNPNAQQSLGGSTNLMGNFGFQQSSQQFPIPQLQQQQQQNLMMNNPAATGMFSQPSSQPIAGVNPLMGSANNSFYPPQFQQAPPTGTATNLNQPMFSNGSLSNIWK